MPAKWFLCPDGQTCEIKDCLKSCRMAKEFPARRCLSIRTLRLIAEQREWTGTPSTTQLLKGTREAYLELIENYILDPQGALFRVHGTKAHALLDQFTGDNELGEIRLNDAICSGQFDLYDDGVLFDSKTWGSYKVMKALGIYQVEVETGEVYKSGARKGQPKKVKQIRTDGEPDLFNEEIQLNDYRMKLEDAGFPVHTMVIEALVRDANTYMATSRGITKAGYLIPIKRLPDEEVKAYLKSKRKALLSALETKIMPLPCNELESWDGRKCAKYCNVAPFCDVGRSKKQNE